MDVWNYIYRLITCKLFENVYYKRSSLTADGKKLQFGGIFLSQCFLCGSQAFTLVLLTYIYSQGRGFRSRETGTLRAVERDIPCFSAGTEYNR